MINRCVAEIYVRDTYRRTGRGRTGFEMHYTRKQCSRRATCPDGFCRQHAKRGNQPRVIREGDRG